MINIFINGEPREITGEMPLVRLLELFSMPTGRIAIELNKKVVRRNDWDNVVIADSDRIEIVHFVGGG